MAITAWRRRAALAARKTAAPGTSACVSWLPIRVAGVPVTQHTALTVSVVWACIRVISETIAALPCRAHLYATGGRKVLAFKHPTDALVHRQASPEMDAFAFRETLLAHALTWGNGYAEIERSRDGRPAALWLLTPDNVEPFRARGGEDVSDGPMTRESVVGELLYRVGSNVILPAANVFHLRGLGFDGIVGYSVISLAARSLGLALALDKDGADFFANGSRPSGVLEVKGAMTPDAKRQTVEDWTRMHSGDNAHKIAVLDRDAKFNPLAIPNKDAQWLEARQWQATDICRWFRVPPHKIGDLSRATFSNIEQQSIEFVQDTVLPWTVRFETECNRKLFAPTETNYFVKANLRGLLRGDMAAQAQFYQAMWAMGVFSPNDILRLEDMDPIGPDGDKRLVQLNLTTLATIGTAPPVATGGDVGDGNTLTGGADTTGTAAADRRLAPRLAPIVRDAIERTLAREEKAGRSKAQDEAFRAKTAETIRAAFEGIVTAMAESAACDAAVLRAIVAAYAEEHVVESSRRCSAGEAVRDELRVSAAVEWLVGKLAAAEAAGGA